MTPPQPTTTSATRALATIGALVVIAAGVVVGTRTTQPPSVPAAPVVATVYPVGVLPDPTRTPGVANPAVTPETVGKTIAVPGWTATVRPPASYTDRLKMEQLKDGYAVPGHTDPHEYEEDHLESLEAGGHPTDPRNLWPSLWHNPYTVGGTTFDIGMKTKDVLEGRVRALILSHTLTLEQGQDALAHDWPASYHKYIGEWPKWKDNL